MTTDSFKTISPLAGPIRLPSFVLAACAGLGLLASSVSLHAKPVPENLGNGLDRLLTSHLAIKEAAARGEKLHTFTSANGKAYTTEENAGLAALALGDNQDRLLVRINPSGKQELDSMIRAMTRKVPSLTVTAVDPSYHGVGVMNAYVAIDDVATLASMSVVRSVILELKPRHSKSASLQTPAPGSRRILEPNNAPLGTLSNQLGTYSDQGIFQHRVTQINKFYNAAASVDYEGSGLSIACISNSFAANAANPASLDVTNFDLPGSASNPRNTTPTFVLVDDLTDNTSDDEGRGMCQIVYKMAPKAKVGFGTADLGEVGFANVIRGLAGINSSTFPNASTQGYAADVICDDVGYFDEPFYEDGIIGAGVNDVVAAGVSYFSSAANDVGVNGYESVIRLVPNGTGLTAAAGNTALANTNINLTGVPTALYAGGFHNFNPNPGQLDVAQLVNVAANNTVPTILQWNDPYDPNAGLQSVGAQIYANTGTITSTTTTVTFNGSSTPPLPTFNANQGYQIVVTATSGGLDSIVSVIDPNGLTVLTQDTGTDETVNFIAQLSGQYQIRVARFGSTTGNFNIVVNLATLTPFVGSDWNLLAFRTDTGAYVAASSLTTNNLSSNTPVEIGFVNRTATGTNSIQYVLARANTPSGPNVADHIRYLLPGNGRAGYGPQEYFTYNTVTTAGHAHAVGCNGTAAYSAFRPSIPEGFTSPGPATIYFDANQNRLATPEIRLQPRVAAMDNGNISTNEGAAGLGSDSGSDFDSAANFSGTSAAAPHAAACALLVLEAHGGSRSVTPAQMTQLLQSTAFPHDLDPNFASGVARSGTNRVTLTFSSDNSNNAGTGYNDTNSLSVAYSGASNITNIIFNPAGTAAQGGNVTGGNNGLDTSNVYFSNIYPGLIWSTGTKAFTVGTGSVGLVQADATATFSNPPAAGQAPTTTLPRTMTLTFPNANFTGGKILRFTVGRGVEHSSSLTGTVPGNGPTGGTSTVNSSADLFGGGVVIPDAYDSTSQSYSYTAQGMTFTVNFADGSQATGTLNNRVGFGYSNLDGYGFINAERAAFTPLTP